MPKIRSAKKRLRQNRTAIARNKAQRSQLRTALKKVRGATDAEARTAAFKEAERLIDRAGRKLLIHPNTAARYKSRLSKSA